jgi:hypothetical protein
MQGDNARIGAGEPALRRRREARGQAARTGAFRAGLRRPGLPRPDDATRRRSTPRRWAAACPRGCSRKSAERAGCATRSCAERGLCRYRHDDDLRRHLGRADRRALAITVDEMKRAGRGHDRGRGRTRPRADEGGAADGAGKPLGPGRTAGAAWSQIWGRVPPLEETVARIDACHAGDVRAIAEDTHGAAPAALALYGPVAGAPEPGAISGERRAPDARPAEGPDRDRPADAAPAGMPISAPGPRCAAKAAIS